MSRGERLLVAIATYNERATLPPLLAQLRQVVPHAEFLIIDDNSPDGTGAWALAEADRDPRCQVLIRPARLGLGTAAHAAFRVAIEREFAWLATLDADGSHDPADLPRLLARIQESRQPPWACVIGSRYCPGGQVVGWPWQRRIASRLVNRFSRWWLRLATRDNSTAFRVYRVAALAALPTATLRSGGYGYLEEIVWRLQRGGAVLDEVPVTFRDRQQGKSKLNFRVALKKLSDLIRLPYLR